MIRAALVSPQHKLLDRRDQSFRHEFVAFVIRVLGIAKERLVFALCRILSQAEEGEARAYLTEAGYGVLPGCIPETSVYRQAQNRGHAITEATGKAITARTDQLMMALLQRVRASLKERGTSQKSGSGTRKQAS